MEDTVTPSISFPPRNNCCDEYIFKSENENELQHKLNDVIAESDKNANEQCDATSHSDNKVLDSNAKVEAKKANIYSNANSNESSDHQTSDNLTIIRSLKKSFKKFADLQSEKVAAALDDYTRIMTSLIKESKNETTRIIEAKINNNNKSYLQTNELQQLLHSNNEQIYDHLPSLVANSVVPIIEEKLKNFKKQIDDEYCAAANIELRLEAVNNKFEDSLKDLEKRLAEQANKNLKLETKLIKRKRKQEIENFANNIVANKLMRVLTDSESEMTDESVATTAPLSNNKTHISVTSPLEAKESQNSHEEIRNYNIDQSENRLNLKRKRKREKKETASFLLKKEAENSRLKMEIENLKFENERQLNSRIKNSQCCAGFIEYHSRISRVQFHFNYTEPLKTVW
jgi:hypothetical protein